LTKVVFRNTSGGAIVKQVDYEYDAYNRLVRRTFDADGAGAGAATNQYWVYEEGINAVLQFDGSSASNLSHRYLWSDNVDELLADEQIAGNNTLWGLADHLGSLRDIADYSESTGVTTIANHRTINSFGKLISETNTSVDLIYAYTGKQFDEATGLQHNLFRWLDPSLGQWLNEDPLSFAAGDENVRRYVGNKVVDSIDPLGLQEPGNTNISAPLPDPFELFALTWEQMRIERFRNGDPRLHGGTIEFTGREVMQFLSIRPYHYHLGIFPVATTDYLTLSRGCMGLNQLRLHSPDRLALVHPDSRYFSTFAAALAAQQGLVATLDSNHRIVMSAFQYNFLDHQLQPFLIPGTEEFPSEVAGRLCGLDLAPGIVPEGNLETFDYVTIHQNPDLSVLFYETMEFGISQNSSLNVLHKSELASPERAGTVYIVTPILDHVRAPLSPQGQIPALIRIRYLPAAN
jgi:RHS repeat-associated protein